MDLRDETYRSEPLSATAKSGNVQCSRCPRPVSCTTDRDVGWYTSCGDLRLRRCVRGFTDDTTCPQLLAQTYWEAWIGDIYYEADMSLVPFSSYERYVRSKRGA